MNDLKVLSRQRKMSLKDAVNLALQRGLSALHAPSGHRAHKSPTFSLGFPPRGTLDKALALASVLEDEEIARKLLLRK